ncbi:MAG TPA: lipoyl(octanoyl) transferase LipB [Solirubrobacteraceae bacterium]|nr:lipoyl(octanoyl) transferase LipB [Solirubrobacteraceae bacterium]
MAATELWVCELGRIGYREALALQERVRAARQRESVPDTLLLLEHDPPVYTRGRRSAPGELSMGEDWYAQRGIEIVQTDRGGKVTYHGPGQLVGYPIVRVPDVVAYVRLLERTLVDALARVGIEARARDAEGPAYTGVWVQERKIASIGVHLARGVTTHGFAVNVQERALEPFNWVVACGLPEVRMTAVESERGDAVVSLESIGALAADGLAAALGHTPRRVRRRALEERIGPTIGVGTLSA